MRPYWGCQGTAPCTTVGGSPSLQSSNLALQGALSFSRRQGLSSPIDLETLRPLSENSQLCVMCRHWLLPYPRSLFIFPLTLSFDSLLLANRSAISIDPFSTRLFSRYIQFPGVSCCVRSSGHVWGRRRDGLGLLGRRRLPTQRHL